MTRKYILISYDETKTGDMFDILQAHLVGNKIPVRIMEYAKDPRHAGNGAGGNAMLRSIG